MGEPITPGLGAPIVGILERRTGIKTLVEMTSGQTYSVFNVCWGRDMGEDWEHVSANISPFVEGASFDFFLTQDVAKLMDPDTDLVLWRR